MHQNYILSKDFPHLEIYQDGKVYSRLANRYLKRHMSLQGYPRVAVKCNGRKATLLVHRLVAIAYIPNPENKPCVNHIDGNKANFSISNLEWCTYRENTQHAIETGLFMRSKRKAAPLEWIKSELATIKPWCRKNSLKMWAEKNGIPYKTAKNWHKAFKNGDL